MDLFWKSPWMWYLTAFTNARSKTTQTHRPPLWSRNTSTLWSKDESEHPACYQHAVQMPARMMVWRTLVRIAPMPELLSSWNPSLSKDCKIFCFHSNMYSWVSPSKHSVLFLEMYSKKLLFQYLMLSWYDSFSSVQFLIYILHGTAFKEIM